MRTLTLRPSRGEIDLPEIAELINICDDFDHLNQGTSVTELQVEFTDPQFQPERDLRLWEGANGKLIAFAHLWVPEAEATQNLGVWFRVLPAERGQGLEEEILTWAEAQLRSICAEKGIPGHLTTSVHDTKVDLVALLPKLGFSIVRYFYRMERSLLDPIPAVALPEGFTVRTLTGEAEVPAWVEAFNQSFIDHWDHHNLTPNERLHWMTSPTYAPKFDRVVVAPDGTLAGFCYSEIDPESNSRQGQQIGNVFIVGVRRGFRRMGLGRAILLSGLHELKAAGMEVARLGVDTQNPNGAKQLYESVGFSPAVTSIVFRKVL